MKFVAVAFVVAGLGWAGAAAAQDQVSDTAFLKANRCKGIAAGLGADATPFKAYLKNQSRSRADMIINKANGEAGQASREAADPANKERLTAELSGPCSAYATASPKVAGRANAAP
jgi:hypothetical protein